MSPIAAATSTDTRRRSMPSGRDCPTRCSKCARTSSAMKPAWWNGPTGWCGCCAMSSPTKGSMHRAVDLGPPSADLTRIRDCEDPMDDKTKTELEAAAFRRLVEHLRERTDVQN